MKDILIIAHFTQAPNEKGNSRFNYIAMQLADDVQNRVEVLTTSFSHRLKTQRVIEKKRLETLPYKFTTLYESGYKKNVSFKRIASHYYFAKKVKKYLQNRVKPDVIYCAIPSTGVAKVVAKYAEKNHVRLIVDVQDLWPEAFKLVFSVPFLSDAILNPIRRAADYAYHQADEIVAVSETYVNRALTVNDKCSYGLSVFLGTDLSEFDKHKSNRKLSEKDGIVRLVYIGTLGHSYDLTCIFDAIQYLNRNENKYLSFRIIGDGPLRDKFEKYSNELNINVEFTGSLEYQEMVKKMTECDIAINPIMCGAAQSITNKVGDYAAAGLPVISTQQCEEYRNLVVEYQMGFNCENENVADYIKKLIEDSELRKNMGINARRCAEERFDRRTSYKKILDAIMNVD